MANIQEQIKAAKAAGYSDNEIAQHISQSPEYGDKMKAALSEGYAPTEILTHLAPVAAAPTAGEIPAARKQYSLGETLTTAPLTAIPSAIKFGGELVEAVKHPVNTIGGLWDAAAGAIGLAVPDNARKFMSRFDTEPGATEHAINTARAVGGVYANKYGDYESIKRTVAEDPVGALADLSMIFSGGAGLARGTAKVAPAVGKVAAGLETAGTYTNPLSAVAPVIGVGGKVVGGTANYLNRLMSPKTAALMGAAENKGPEIVNALRNYDEFVAGGMPIAGVAATPTGATKYAALQQELKGYLPSEYYARGQANVGARKGALQPIAQDEAAIAAAEKGRTAVTKPLYGAADKQIIKADDAFVALLERPSMEKAIARAKELAKERNETFQIGKNAPEQKVGSTIVDTEGRPLDTKTLPAEYAKFNGKSLHYLKLAMDDLIKDPHTFGLGSNEVAAIKGTRGAFLNWFENKSGKYAEARAAYSEMSKPINVMQVGQYLEGKLQPALDTSTAERAGIFSEALRNAPGTIKKSTGLTRFDKLSDVLAPDQVKIVENIRNDLAREAEFKQQAKAGAGSKVLPATELPKSPAFFSAAATLANTIVTKLQGKIDKKLAIELATEMLDPKLAAAALEKAMARQAKGEKLADPFVRGGAGAQRLMRGESGVGLRAPLTLGGVQTQNQLAPENRNNLGK